MPIHQSLGQRSRHLNIKARFAILSPLGLPSLSIVRAGLQAGFRSVLDLGDPSADGRRATLHALSELSHAGPIAIRVSMVNRNGAWRAEELRTWVETGLIQQVIIDESDDWGAWSALRAVATRPYELWVEVRSDEGLERADQDSRVSGIVITSEEAAGACGHRSAFLWLQRLSRRPLTKPFYLRGGMTVSGIVAAICAGVEKVLIDEHLIGCAEQSDIDHELLHIIDRLSVQHSQKVLVSTEVPHPLLEGRTESDKRYARLLTWPQSAGWKLVKALREREGDLGDQEPPFLSDHQGWGGTLDRSLIPMSSTWPSINRTQRELRAKLGEPPRCVEIMEGLISDVIERIELIFDQRAPLCPPSSLAESLGIRYPLFQGPMTRVSDTPTFAHAVAKEGALPFIALSLMREEQARSVLEATKKLLEDRPWGVGVLGFSPPELRQLHFDLIKEYRPSAVLIAGGRPSLSRELEAEGIPSYLHAPSPTLLERFIEEGARRFIFEGSECGGHIGPLSSFSLWDSQLEVLERSPVIGEIEAIFAGGIHDSISAGLLTAISSKIVSLGAKVGAVMGTGYLFTKEAVETGAIIPRYQEVAIELSHTTTINTAPGHSTRCAPTGFIEAFEARRQECLEQGIQDRELWSHLEEFNVGRLRVASKGVERQGDQIVEVNAKEQERVGMYMMGEVATLRDQATTIKTLHDEVALESEDWIKGRLEALTSSEVASDSNYDPSNDEIAIIGMACLFPQASSSQSFWANILNGVDSITEIPQERWSIKQYYDPEAPAGSKSSSKWGGFLDPVPFDPMRYGIPPKTLTAVEPVQLLALEVSARALNDAGYAACPGERGRKLNREMTSVIFGAEAGTDLAGAYTLRGLYPQWLGELPPSLDEALPSLTEDSFAGVLANVISGRIANRLDLGGCNYTVDAACASSLAALDSAVKSLRSGESEVVICGGADLHNSVNDYLMFSSVHALSKTGRCRPFDQSADGIALGEGVAALVLKRARDARREGDRIYALVSSVAGSSDGKALGLTAPRREGQIRALRRAYERAGVRPSELGLIEAHGTGTVVGDRTELESLTEVYRSDREQSLSITESKVSLGSVKSMIGHTKCAAGMAGLIKAALSIQQGVRSPTLHLSEPNHAYTPDESPFCFERSSRPWTTPASKRRAGVSAFGFGGTNFHAVLKGESCDGLRLNESAHWMCEPLLIRASNHEAAIELARRYYDALVVRSEHEATLSLSLKDLAYSLSQEQFGQALRAVLIVTNVKEALEGLMAFISGTEHACLITADAPLSPGERGAQDLAFIFPGQGAQSLSMMSEWFISLPSLAHRLCEHPKYADFIFPHSPSNREEKRAQLSRLTDTRVAQPALGLCDLAALELIKSLGVEAQHLGGHSYGELVALTAAGVILESELPLLSALRGEHILKATGALNEGGDPGKMAAIKGGAVEVATALSSMPSLSEVVLANLNAPSQTVISGPSDQIEDAIKHLKSVGLKGREIPVACAFHSGLVKEAAKTFSDLVSTFSLKPERLKRYTVWSNQHAVPYSYEKLSEVSLSERLGAHIAAPVRFVEQIEMMIKSGVKVFVEVGPGRILSGLIEQISENLGLNKELKIIPLAPGRGTLRELWIALSQLDQAGVAIDWGQLWRQRGATLLTPEELSQAKKIPLKWWVNGMRAWPDQGPKPSNFLNPPNHESYQLTSPNHIQNATILTGSKVDVEISSRSNENQSEVLSEPHALDKEPYAWETEMRDPSKSIHQSILTQSSHSELGRAAQAYFESMRHLAAAQERVMLALLNQGAEGLHPQHIPALSQPSSIASYPGLEPPPQDHVIDFWSTPSPQSSPPSPEIPSVSDDPSSFERAVAITESLEQTDDNEQSSSKPIAIEGALVELVSERTGYPVEMLSLDLDLESDLSVDSIKRIEILGALAERLGLTQGDESERDEMIEELAVMKTLSEMISWLENRLSLSNDQSNRQEIETSGSSDLSEEVMRPKSKGERLPRMTRQWVAAPLKHSPKKTRSHDRLLDLFELKTDGLPKEPLEHLFDHLKSITIQFKSAPDDTASPSLIIVTPHPETPSEALVYGGISGLVKSVLKEWKELSPKAQLRLVTLPRSLDEQQKSELILAEEGSPFSNEMESVRYRWVNNTLHREAEIYIDDPLSLIAEITEATQTLNDYQPEIILVTGGARGVTAECLKMLAKMEPGHTYLLLGRTPHPETAELLDLELAQSSMNEQELRSSLASAFPQLKIKELGSRARLAWAQKEINDTLNELNQNTNLCQYFSMDIAACDQDEFFTFLKTKQISFDQITTVIHAAGLIDDQRIVDKSLERFRSVISPKVNGAEVLLNALPKVKRWIFFSSVSSALGNIGQSDYSAANSALDELALTLQHGQEEKDTTQRKALSIQWGPWVGAGMVNESLARAYEARGLKMITLQEGSAAFVNEWRYLHHPLIESTSCIALRSWPFSSQ